MTAQPIQVLQTAVYADGTQVDYSYNAAAQPKFVKYNRGFAIVFDYAANANVSAACGFNLAQTFADASTTCTGAALKVSFRRGRSFEEVVISPIEVMLARVTHRGERREWRFNPLWTKLTKVEDDEYGMQTLTLVSRREFVVVARDASPPEREVIADGLTRALAKVKKGY